MHNESPAATKIRFSLGRRSRERTAMQRRNIGMTNEEWSDYRERLDLSFDLVDQAVTTCDPELFAMAVQESRRTTNLLLSNLITTMPGQKKPVGNVINLFPSIVD